MNVISEVLQIITIYGHLNNTRNISIIEITLQLAKGLFKYIRLCRRGFEQDILAREMTQRNDCSSDD